SGTFNPQILADTAWPIDCGDTKRSCKTESTLNYPVVKWVRDLGVTYGGSITRGFNEEIFIKTQGGTITQNPANHTKAIFDRLNRQTGQSVASTYWSGATYSATRHVISADGTIYISDIFNDILIAYDSSNWKIKWTYAFVGGHDFGGIIIGNDGTIYIGRMEASDINLYVYAFNPDGSVKWSKSIPNTSGPGAYSGGEFALDLNGNLIFAMTHYQDPSQGYNDGKLFSFSPIDGSINWEYPTGDVRALAIDSDGVIYTASYDGYGKTTSKPRKFFAINSDGSLKWEINFGNYEWYFSNILIDSNKTSIAFKTFQYKQGTENDYSAFNRTGIVSIDLNTHSIIYDKTVDEYGYYYYSIMEQDGGIYLPVSFYEMGASPLYRSNNKIVFIDKNGDIKFQFKQPDRQFVYSNFMMDEDGNSYFMITDEKSGGFAGYTTKLVALEEWRAIVIPEVVSSGPKSVIKFTVKTNLGESNPIVNEDNLIQILLNEDIQVPLTFSYIDSEGNNVWEGSYSPEGDFEDRYSYRLEASEAGLETDNGLNFDLSASGSNGTGMITEGTINMGELIGTGENIKWVSIFIYLALLISLRIFIKNKNNYL
ncbi:MAG: PQQ-binding-like beta-propeller repeat protein, partial [Atribacterota bacterium]|nr:PQQ-binding-like beta-propeller repeat protein [Atribacterota bacterium]